MNADRLFDSLREEVRRLMPDDLDITSIEFEGPMVVVYTKEYDKVSGDNKTARELAQSLHKRVDIRPDPSTLSDSKIVEERLRELIPEEAGIFDIFFNDDTGEAVVEAIKPDVVKGSEGSLILNLKQETGWNVKVIRTPPIPSKTVADVRGYLRTYKNERHDMLSRVARKLARPMLGSEQWVRMTTMGGFRQIGRSATLLTTRESKILIDCGLDPGSDDTP